MSALAVPASSVLSLSLDSSSWTLWLWAWLADPMVRSRSSNSLVVPSSSRWSNSSLSFMPTRDDTISCSCPSFSWSCADHCSCSCRTCFSRANSHSCCCRRNPSSNSLCSVAWCSSKRCICRANRSITAFSLSWWSFSSSMAAATALGVVFCGGFSSTGLDGTGLDGTGGGGGGGPAFVGLGGSVGFCEPKPIKEKMSPSRVRVVCCGGCGLGGGGC